MDCRWVLDAIVRIIPSRRTNGQTTSSLTPDIDPRSQLGHPQADQRFPASTLFVQWRRIACFLNCIAWTLNNKIDVTCRLCTDIKMFLTGPLHSSPLRERWSHTVNTLDKMSSISPSEPSQSSTPSHLLNSPNLPLDPCDHRPNASFLQGHLLHALDILWRDVCHRVS